jgi:hypothetical protein
MAISLTTSFLFSHQPSILKQRTDSKQSWHGQNFAISDHTDAMRYLLRELLYLHSPKRRKHNQTLDLAILVRNELRTADLSAQKSLRTSLFILYLCRSRMRYKNSALLKVSYQPMQLVSKLKSSSKKLVTFTGLS